MNVISAAIFQNQESLKRLPSKSSVYNAEVTAIDLAINMIVSNKLTQNSTRQAT